MLIGNVGKDPEVRYLEGNGQNAKVATFSLATTERYKDRNGEPKENTEWHNIVVWRQLADFVEKYVKKGSQLYIEGKLRTRSYEQNGVKKYVTEVVADTLQALGRRSDESGAPSTTYTQRSSTTSQPLDTQRSNTQAQVSTNNGEMSRSQTYNPPPISKTTISESGPIDINSIDDQDDLPF